MQLADGIHKIDGIRGTNAYLVENDDGLLLVDSATPGAAGRICRYMTAIGRQPSEVHDIVLTHFDLDHVGSARALRKRTGARIAIHRLDAPVLAREQPPHDRMLVVVVLYRLLVRPLVADRLLSDDDMIGGLRVMHVPGHTAGSITLVRGDGVVFSGDALLSDEHGQIIPPDPRLASDPAQASESAERIKALQPRLLLPGHGAPVTTATFSTSKESGEMR